MRFITTSRQKGNCSGTNVGAVSIFDFGSVPPSVLRQNDGDLFQQLHLILNDNDNYQSPSTMNVPGSSPGVQSVERILSAISLSAGMQTPFTKMFPEAIPGTCA